MSTRLFTTVKSLLVLRESLKFSSLPRIKSPIKMGFVGIMDFSLAKHIFYWSKDGIIICLNPWDEI